MDSFERDTERIKGIISSILDFLWLYDYNHDTTLYNQFKDLSIKWKDLEALKEISLFIQENIPQTPEDQIVWLIYAKLFSTDVSTVYRMFNKIDV